MKMKEMIIEAENVTKTYEGESEAVLKEVQLSVKKGEFVAIMGKSGSGKTTLLYALSGMDSISSGKIHFLGEPIHQMKEKDLCRLRLSKMGFIFQHSYLLKNLSIQENIQLPSRQLKNKRKEVTIREADCLMKRLEIDHVAHQEIAKVSGGQLQRAAICRALMNEPEIIFGDEPTGALNSSAAEEVLRIFTELNQEGTGIFIVTHDAKVAARADRVIYLKDGRIHAQLEQGKFQPNEMCEERYKKINQWLEEQGF